MNPAHDSEASVVGGCMLDPQAYWQIADKLAVEDFADPAFRALYQLVSRRVRENEAVDYITIGEISPKLARVAVEAANATPGTANIRAHADLIVKHATHRRVLAAGQKIVKLGAQDAFSEATRLVSDASRTDLSSLRSAKDVLSEFVVDLQTKCDQASKITGLATGFSDLDEATSGLQPGDLIVVAGRPSMGKSTLAQNFAENVSLRPGKSVLLFSQEMTAANWMARSVSSVGGVPFGAVRSPRTLDEAHWVRVGDAVKRLKESGLIFDEACGITAEQICARARQCHASAENELVLIVIDYLQYMQFGKHETQAMAVQEVTRSLKGLAKALRVPVVLLSQLNRKLEERADKRPIMADLRESGAIEQDADVIMFLYRDEVYNKQSYAKGYTELILAKQRNGVQCTVPLLSRLDQMRFENCPDGLPQKPEREDGPRRNAGIAGFARDRKAQAAGR